MRRSATPLAALVLAGCLSDTTRTDPYAGMDCDQKIEAISREVREFQAAQGGAAKVSAQPSDSVRADSAKPDSGSRIIQKLQGWPPVAGLDPISDPDTGTVGPVDPRDQGSIVPTDPGPGVVWIPPVGFIPTGAVPGSLPDSLAKNPETTSPMIKPESISAVQVVSTAAYRVHVRIFDRHDALIREFDQDFGYRGELSNPYRAVPNGFVSYLVWDHKDASGIVVPSGVYLWRARLTAETGQVTEMATKTGFIGEECRQAP